MQIIIFQLLYENIYFIYKDYSYFIDNLTYRLASINVLCVKIFQAIALNNNLIDDKTNNKLLIIQSTTLSTLLSILKADLTAQKSTNIYKKNEQGK